MVQSEILQGLPDQMREEALRTSFRAFRGKLRIGFRNEDAFVRLFRDSVDSGFCLTASQEEGFTGLLTIHLRSGEFYRLSPWLVLRRFNPWRALPIM